MPKVLNGAAVLSALALICAAAPAVAQRGTAPSVAAMNAVMDYRARWVGDSTVFDGCSVYAALGRPAAFPAGINPQLVRLLDRTRDPCAADPGRALSRYPRHVVRVDSLAVMDSTVRVDLTVQKGERKYRERYLVGALSTGGWVREMRTWGVVREYPVRPRRPSASP